MTNRITRLLAVFTLLVGGLSACSDSPAPTEVIAPSAVAPSYGYAATTFSFSEATFYTDIMGAELVSTGTYHSGHVSVWTVGPAGGTISVGNHSLEIPQNAVVEPTEFTMSEVAGSNILVDLTARSVSNGDVVSWFPVPLTLTLSYKDVLKNNEAKRLRNVFLYQDSPNYLIPLYTTQDKRRKTLSSPIFHFSLYGMAIE